MEGELLSRSLVSCPFVGAHRDKRLAAQSIWLLPLKLSAISYLEWGMATAPSLPSASCRCESSFHAGTSRAPLVDAPGALACADARALGCVGKRPRRRPPRAIAQVCIDRSTRSLARPCFPASKRAQNTLLWTTRALQGPFEGSTERCWKFPPSPPVFTVSKMASGLIFVHSLCCECRRVFSTPAEDDLMPADVLLGLLESMVGRRK